MIDAQFLNNPAIVQAQARLAGIVEIVRQWPVSVWKTLVYAIALIWAVRSLAALFWVVMPVPDVAAPPILAKPPVSQPTTSGVVVNLESIQAANLFGDLVKEPVITETKPKEALPGIEDNARTTRLNLKLQGILASSDPQKAHAIIADGNTQALYKVGESLKNPGVKLAKVMEQRVILDNNGSYESLWLYSEEDFKRSKAISKREIRVPDQTQRQPTPDVVASAQAPRGRTAPYDADRTIVRKVPPSKMPKSVGDVVRFSIHREGGKMVGYRIRPGRDRDLFEQAGLKNNDIVTSVNGISMDDPRKLREVYQNLKTAPSAQLEVLRDGQSYSINLSLGDG